MKGAALRLFPLLFSYIVPEQDKYNMGVHCAGV
jgi:hypothetical protein